MKKFVDKIKENKKKTIIISSIIVVVLILGISYAFFFGKAEGSPTNVLFANLSINYTDGDVINLTNSLPMTEDMVDTFASKKEFKVENTSKTPIYLDIRLDEIKMDSALKNENFMYTVYKGSEVVDSGDFTDVTDENQIVLTKGIKLEPKDPTDFSIALWIKDTGDNQNTLLNQTLNAKVTVIANDKYVGLPRLTSLILGEDNKNVTKTAPDFSTTSKDKGLYVQQGDETKSIGGKPTYYYRGAVTNNYVQFGTYKTTDGGNTKDKPIIWRIVRINEDGSIRLISENNISDTVVWTNKGTANYDESDIKGIVDTWYTKNITEDALNKKVQTSSYCNDITDNYGAVKNRIKTNNPPTPIFTCPVGSIITNEKAGLITADEMEYGGALTSKVTDNTTYLDNRTLFWTSSPDSSNRAWYWNPDYLILGTLVSGGNYAAARPVINLKSNVTVISGSGTSSSPFIIG